MKAKVQIPILRSETWNDMIEVVRKRLPLRFVRTGQRWTHPWTIVPEWNDDPDVKSWVFRIQPGFVNGVEPEIETMAKLASERTIERIRKQTCKTLTGKTPVRALVTERPAIIIRDTRAIGKKIDLTAVDGLDNPLPGMAQEAVPEFFQQFGLTQKSVVFAGNLQTGIKVVETDEPNEEEPVLRAVDVALYLDRPAAKLEVIHGEAGTEGFTNLLVINYGRTSAARERPYLRVASKFIPPVTRELESLLQQATDPEVDCISVATIYFLSPPTTDPSSPLDEKWTPFVKHDLFWNLAHAPQRIPDPTPIDPIVMRTGLALGIADPLFNQILANDNEAFNEALQVLRNRNLAGRFWSL